MNASRLMWTTAVVMVAMWCVGFVAGAGMWIHALALTGALLMGFDLLVARRENGPRGRFRTPPSAGPPRRGAGRR
ncbi:MAG: hypothetical protein HYU66_15740 [Armatimonadetes bacterium]|nr:hypothetical protein [Armatimonadota bacterium]